MVVVVHTLNNLLIYLKNIIDRLGLIKNTIIFGENEFFIEYYDDELQKRRKYFYDFVDIKNKIIIEYNGINWHPNKEKMSVEKYEKWYHPFDKNIDKTLLEKKDIHKKKVAEENNFETLILWDTDIDDYNIDIVYNYYKNKNLI